MTIKSNLKKARESKGLTQIEIAEQTKINPRSYHRYESGERIPNVRTAILIAKVLNSTVEELFDDCLLEQDLSNSSN